MTLTFHTLDVFTRQRLAGNPLAVVLDADGLDADRMQDIAREFNLPETVFAMRPSNPAHWAKIRIFTPAAEIQFGGHPTIGTAVLLAELRMAAMGANQDALITLEIEIGIVRVGVRMAAGTASFAEFDAPMLPQSAGSLAPAEQLAAALDLIPSEIGFANHRPSRFSAGNSFAFIPVRSLSAIAKARPAGAAWPTAFGGQGLVGAYLYTNETVHKSSAFHARMFAPDFGIAEDPATGSAAVALAGVVQRFDAPPDGVHKRMIEQGYEMGRPSSVEMSLEISGGELGGVRIGGAAVRVSEGTLLV
ncbi:MAG: PhzF family phenazine biosynthesis protein [Hyphomicrobiaceae bacterium]